MPDKTVTLADPEWQQLVAILAQASGFLTIQKLVNQLQAQEGTRQDQPEARPRKGDGFDLDAEGVLHRARVAEPGR